MTRFELVVLGLCIALGFYAYANDGVGNIVSEQVVESHSVSSVTQTDGNRATTYHVIEQVEGTDVANTYTSDMMGFEVRDDDGLGQRVDKVSVERIDLIGTRRFDEYRLYMRE